MKLDCWSIARIARAHTTSEAETTDPVAADTRSSLSSSVAACRPQARASERGRRLPGGERGRMLPAAGGRQGRRGERTAAHRGARQLDFRRGGAVAVALAAVGREQLAFQLGCDQILAGPADRERWQPEEGAQLVRLKRRHAGPGGADRGCSSLWCRELT